MKFTLMLYFLSVAATLVVISKEPVSPEELTPVSMYTETVRHIQG